MNIEFAAVVLFAGCFWHAARYESRAFAQQWFIGGFLFAVIRETVILVVLQIYDFSPTILRIGVVPALVCLLTPSLIYLAYHFARRFSASPNLAPIAGLMFVVAASITLPLEATAAQTGWWTYTTPARMLFGGMPLTAPLIWGGSATIFYAIFWRVRGTPLPERGKLYAMVTLSPLIAAVHLLWMLILQLVG